MYKLMIYIPSVLFIVTSRSLSFLPPPHKPQKHMLWDHTISHSIIVWSYPSRLKWFITWLTVFMECNIGIQAENSSNTLDFQFLHLLTSNNFKISILGFLLCAYHSPPRFPGLYPLIPPAPTILWVQRCW